MRILIALAFAAAAAGCGQTGSLYLPDESVETTHCLVPVAA